jgi:hypothetical protein
MFNNLNLIHEEICKGVKKANDYFNKNGIDAKAYMPENLTLINKTDGEKDMNSVIRPVSNNQIKKRAAEAFNKKRREDLLIQKTIKDNRHNRPNKRRRISPTKDMAVPYGEQNPKFDSPSVLISTWDELSKVKASVPGFWLRITPEDGSGWIVPDECKHEEDDSEFRSEYLSTHTFYGLNYKQSTEVLQRYGFNVIIDNWDK